MKPPKPEACKECPFKRKALPGYTGSESVEDFVMSAIGEAEMPCHLEVDYDRKDWKEQCEKVHQCTGRAIFMRNTCKVPRNPNLICLPTNTVNFFSNPIEFLEHHQNRAKSFEKPQE